MRSRIILTLFILLQAPVLLIAQQFRIPLVDITTSEKLIQTNQTRIQEMENENQQLQAELNQLAEEIAEQKKNLVSLDPLEQRIRAKKEELIVVARKIMDANAIEQTRLAILKNDDLAHRVTLSRGEIRRAIYLKEQKVLKNQTLMTNNLKKIDELTDETTYLKAAVEKSKLLQTDLDQYMADIEAYLKETDSFISKVQNSVEK